MLMTTRFALPPRCFWMKGARPRAMMSVSPPAAKPTTISMGLSSGQAAWAVVRVEASIAASTAVRLKVLNMGKMSPSVL
ncbi:hypothetical protein ACFJGX_08140 [Hydrogenophaga sp. UC242_50]|uniref:hypothetical protein n=1 Tax=Hydrogenophaga sp. UC242_50 TaxID=3350169 RepID=UPI0036D252EF